MANLTELKVRNAKFSPEKKRLHDAAGLYLQLSPSGGKHWRLKYFHPAGRERLLCLGSYPVMSLAEARRRRDEARLKLQDGIDPGAEKAARAAAAATAADNSLEVISREWIDSVHRQEVVKAHADRNLRRLELHVFPTLGHRPIAEIEPLEIAACLQRLLRTQREATAQKIRPMLSQIFRYAIATGRATRDAARDAAGAIPKSDKKKAKHFAAAIKPQEIIPVLRAIDSYRGFPSTVAALKLATLLFPRPWALAAMRWSDIDRNAGTWDYTPGKNATPMLVPLPHQARSVLDEMWVMRRTGSPYVFPGVRSSKRPMTTAALSNAMLSMGMRDTQKVHGFRATARTLLDEKFGFLIPVIEMQLGHAVKDANGRAYNRTSYLDQRAEMLQRWADYLDELRRTNNQGDHSQHYESGAAHALA